MSDQETATQARAGSASSPFPAAVVLEFLATPVGQRLSEDVGREAMVLTSTRADG